MYARCTLYVLALAPNDLVLLSCHPLFMHGVCAARPPAKISIARTSVLYIPLCVQVKSTTLNKTKNCVQRCVHLLTQTHAPIHTLHAHSCYVIIYGFILLRRIRSGEVTPAMLSYVRQNVSIFVTIGLLEALTFLLALYSAARIPGGLIGVLGQVASLTWMAYLYET